MDKCPDCKKLLCDVGLYYREDNKNSTSKKANKKTLIKCPVCGSIKPYGDWK